MHTLSVRSFLTLTSRLFSRVGILRGIGTLPKISSWKIHPITVNCSKNWPTKPSSLRKYPISSLWSLYFKQLILNLIRRGGNLYKRDLRNRRRSSSSRRRSRNSESAFNSNTQRSSNEEENSQGETTQDEYSSDKSSDDEGMHVSFKELPPLPVIRIPAVLKKAIGYDEYLITIKRKVCLVVSNVNVPTFFLEFSLTNILCSVNEVAFGAHYRYRSRVICTLLCYPWIACVYFQTNAKIEVRRPGHEVNFAFLRFSCSNVH